MNIQSWWIASRPKTLIVSFAPVLLGLALSYNNQVFSSISVGLLTLLASIFIQLGTNFINDLYDFLSGADDQNRLGPTRVVQAGLLSQSQVRKAAYFNFSIALLIGVYLVMIGGIPILLIGSFALISGYCYTAGPYPLGYNGLGDIFVFIFYGLIAVPGTYYLQSGILFNVDSIIIGSSIGFIAVAILCVNNIRDINSDQKVGKKTIAVRFGSKFVIILYGLMIIFPYFCILLLINRPSFYWDLDLCLIFFSVPIGIKLIIDINRKKDKELNLVLSGTSNFMRIFFILLIIGILL
jgi:1,4-dihydroxy-2-naphthoate polyprenyltransferase